MRREFAATGPAPKQVEKFDEEEEEQEEEAILELELTLEKEPKGSGLEQ